MLLRVKSSAHITHWQKSTILTEVVMPQRYLAPIAF